MINPKSHDSLFKWLIAAFTDEFFAHYFPCLIRSPFPLKGGLMAKKYRLYIKYNPDLIPVFHRNQSGRKKVS